MKTNSTPPLGSLVATALEYAGSSLAAALLELGLSAIGSRSSGAVRWRPLFAGRSARRDRARPASR